MQKNVLTFLQVLSQSIPHLFASVSYMCRTALQAVCLPCEPSDVAFWNICSILVTFDTSHLEMSLLNDVACLNMLFMLATFDTSHSEMSLLNDVAPLNIEGILVTLDTSHLEMSQSNSSK